jgi:RNA polymerase sigma-70 factor (ECF subfamily)
MKLQYGIDKYAKVMMMRACGRIADRRGNRRARPNKKLENAATDPASAAESVSRPKDQRVRCRVRPLSDADNAVADGPTPLEQVEQLQSAEEIAAEINRLSTSLREPLRYIFYDGLTISQTAAKLGVTPNAVRLRLHRAKQELRPRLSRFCK